MTSRALSRGWLLIDLPRTIVLLAWIAFGCSILFYFSDWFPHWRDVVIAPQANSGTRIDQANSGTRVDKDESDKLYNGLIFIVPTRGDRCWERVLDNRTGRMWDKGYVNCDEAAARLAAQSQPEGLSALRMRAIGKAFLPQRD